MKVLITGATGLIGTALRRSFKEKGWDLVLATRGEPEANNEVRWDPVEGFADPSAIGGIDAVIHLAGESISGLRWTEEKKQKIRDSRVEGTRTLVDAISNLKPRPKVLVAASGVGFYGDRGDEILTELSPSGDTFLAKTCKEWEAESRRAEDSGIRTVLIRTGLVLSKDGGALGSMLMPFKLGLGGVIGSGKQWMSWISLDDIVAVYTEAVENNELRGAVNAVSPHPVTNEEFTKTLGGVLYRPTFLPLPEFAVNFVLGEMGDALLIDSTRAEPQRLTEHDFEFRYPELPGALEHELR